MPANEIDIIIDAKRGTLYRTLYGGGETTLAGLTPWATGQTLTANVFLVESTAAGGLRSLSIPTDTAFKLGRNPAPIGLGYATFTFTSSVTIPMDELDERRLEDDLNGLAAMIAAGGIDIRGSGGDYIGVFRTVGDKSAITAAVDAVPTVSATIDVIQAGTASVREKVSIRLVEDTCAAVTSWTAISASAANVTAQQDGAALRHVELIELDGFPSGGSFTYSHTTNTGDPISVFATAAELEALLTTKTVEKVAPFKWRVTWAAVGTATTGTTDATAIEEFAGITASLALTSTQLYAVLNGEAKTIRAEIADDGGEPYYAEEIAVAPTVGDVGPGVASAGVFLPLAGGTMTGQLAFSGTDFAGVRAGPSLTTTERDALTPGEGDLIYNETTATVQVYQGSAWVSVGGSGDMLAATYDAAGIAEQLVGLTATQTLTNKTLTAPVIATGDGVFDSNGNEILIFDPGFTAVNYLSIASRPTGRGPEIQALGDDTNIDIELDPKGSGGVKIFNAADTYGVTLTTGVSADRAQSFPDVAGILVTRPVSSQTTGNLMQWDGSGINDSGIFASGGNVGIGETSLAAPLHITDATGPQVRIGADTGTNYFAIDCAADGDTTLSATGTSGDITLAADVHIPQYFYHQNDTDTYLRFLTNRCLHTAGGVTIWDSNNGDMNIGNGVLFTDIGESRVGINTTSPSTALDVVGGVTLSVTAVNAATYDLLVTDYILNCTYTSTGAITSLTLPTAQVAAGRTIVVKDSGGNAGTNSITIDTEGETIDGDATAVIAGDYGSITIYCDGSNWFII